MAKPSSTKPATARGRRPARATKSKPAPATPWLEWAAAALGAVLTLAVIGALLVDVGGGAGRPPEFEVRKLEILTLRDASLVKIEIRNIGDEPAEQIEVEGVLRTAQGEEMSSVTFADIPARSSRRGGLMFKGPARDGTLELSARGYVEP